MSVYTVQPWGLHVSYGTHLLRYNDLLWEEQALGMHCPQGLDAEWDVETHEAHLQPGAQAWNRARQAILPRWAEPQKLYKPQAWHQYRLECPLSAESPCRPAWREQQLTGKSDAMPRVPSKISFSELVLSAPQVQEQKNWACSYWPELSTIQDLPPAPQKRKLLLLCQKIPSLITLPHGRKQACCVTVVWCSVHGSMWHSTVQHGIIQNSRAWHSDKTV